MDQTDPASDQNRACNKRSIAAAPDGAPEGAFGPQSTIENQQSTIDEDSTPIPPRYWWLKRITIGVAALLVFLIALRLWWGWEANRRLQAEIDRIVAAGEPIFPEDFNPKQNISDEENAAKHFLQAVASLADTPETNDHKRILVEVMAVPGPAGETRLAEAAAMAAQNETAFRSLRRARGCAAVDFGVRWARPTLQNMAKLRTVRAAWRDGLGLMNLAIWAAVQKQAVGDHAETVELFQDALAADRLLLQESDLSQFFLLSELVERAAFRALAEGVVAVELELGKTSTPNPRLATLNQLRRLRDELLDESQRIRQMRAILHLSRMRELDILTFSRPPNLAIPTFHGVARGPQTWRTTLLKPIFAPLFDIQAANVASRTSRVADALGVESLRLALDTIGPNDFLQLPHQSLLDGPSGQADPNRLMLRLHFQELALRRIATIVIGTQLFHAEHERWPASLAEMVPDYLPVVPSDPLAPDDRPMGFLPQCRVPIVFSVGPDCVERGRCSGTPYGPDPCQGAFDFEWTVWFNPWTRGLTQRPAPG